MKSFCFAARKSASVTLVFATGILLALTAFAASRIRADDKADSQKQFERAVAMRAMLEGYLERDRSRADYQRTALAFRKVYLITPEAPNATPALIAEAELYEAMGRLFEAKFFHEAIGRYNFLLKQYPGTRYRADVLFAIGKIEKDDLKASENAAATFQDFLQHYPRSDKAGQARQALKEIAAAREPVPPAVALQPSQPAQANASRNPTDNGKAREEQKPAENVNAAQPDLRGQAVEPRVSDQRISSVMKLQTWNSPGATRIVVTLNDTINYESARILSPDRIYFNLYKAKVGLKLTRKALEVNDGLLQSVRIAQNAPDVVRLVLSVDGERDYSAFLLANPYRLVIDLHSRGSSSTAKATPAPNASPAETAAPLPAAAPAIPSNVPLGGTGESATIRDAAAGSLTKSTAPPILPAAPSKVAQKTALPLSKNSGKTAALLQPPPAPKPTRDGDRSLARALGLKISRIVIDPGHGGHDTGTIGPRGLMEKDLCLDVAFRLGGLIEQKLPGAEVIYTRKDDSFVSLEERTNIANEGHADLFISIHANSSQDSSARGVETYYLNFATTKESMEVASRENALSQESLHDLEGLIQKIARNDKIEESKEFASDVQESLTQLLQLVSRSERNRGVKKAPFVVLIGANMPSILTEISFVSNPSDEKLLRRVDQRQRIADGLFRGISSYLDSLNSLSNNKQKLVSATPADTPAVASNGNPK